MKVKEYCSGDFGGVTYKQGDFHTVGFSGAPKAPQKGMGGNFFEDAFRSVFGQGASQVTSSLQAGATSVVTNVVGSKLTTDASAKQGIVDTVKASVGELYKEYKIPVIIIGGGISALLVYGIYNAVKKK